MPSLAENACDEYKPLRSPNLLGALSGAYKCYPRRAFHNNPKLPHLWRGGSSPLSEENPDIDGSTDGDGDGDVGMAGVEDVLYQRPMPSKIGEAVSNPIGPNQESSSHVEKQ